VQQRFGWCASAESLINRHGARLVEIFPIPDDCPVPSPGWICSQDPFPNPNASDQDA
jgi:hypothetical protein